jgi:ATP-dependent Clp protease ATP-binding subunit ClpC
VFRFDTMTDDMRRTLSLAQDEAARFDRNYVDTEQLLLGLLRLGGGAGIEVLRNLRIDLSGLRAATELEVEKGDLPVVGDVGLTPRAKRVIELSIDEARRLDHHYLGTEHLLLGLVRETGGLAASVLAAFGVTLERARNEVARLGGRQAQSE